MCHEHANCLACVQESKIGAMCGEQFRRAAPRGGVATEEAEADESCDRIPPFPQNKITGHLPGDFIFVNGEGKNHRLIKVIAGLSVSIDIIFKIYSGCLLRGWGFRSVRIPPFSAAAEFCISLCEMLRHKGSCVCPPSRAHTIDLLPLFCLLSLL